MRRPLSSKAQSKPKPAKLEKVPEYSNNFAFQRHAPGPSLPHKGRELLHDLDFCSRPWRNFVNSYAMRCRSHGTGTPAQTCRSLAVSSATQRHVFGQEFPFSVGEERRLPYSDVSGPQRAKCMAASPLLAWGPQASRPHLWVSHTITERDSHLPGGRGRGRHHKYTVVPKHDASSGVVVERPKNFGGSRMRRVCRAAIAAVLITTSSAAHSAGQGNLLRQRSGPSQENAIEGPNLREPTVTVFDHQEVQGILGREVRSGANENMGRIVDVLVDRDGEVRAAIIDFGGFLGVGSRKIAVAWDALRFPFDAKKTEPIRLDLTRDQVQAAPEYKEDKQVVVLGASGRLESLPF